MAYPPGGDSFIIIMWLIQGHAAGQGMVLASFLGDSPNLGVLYFVICPNQGPKMEGVVLHRVGVLGLFCPKQGQGFKPSAAALPPFPPPRPFPVSFSVCTSVPVCQNSFLFFFTISILEGLVVGLRYMSYCIWLMALFSLTWKYFLHLRQVGWLYNVLFYFLVDVLLYVYTSGTTGNPKPAIVTNEK